MFQQPEILDPNRPSHFYYSVRKHSLPEDCARNRLESIPRKTYVPLLPLQRRLQVPLWGFWVFAFFLLGVKVYLGASQLESGLTWTGNTSTPFGQYLWTLEEISSPDSRASDKASSSSFVYHLTLRPVDSLHQETEPFFIQWSSISWTKESMPKVEEKKELNSIVFSSDFHKAETNQPVEYEFMTPEPLKSFVLKSLWNKHIVMIQSDSK